MLDRKKKNNNDILNFSAYQIGNLLSENFQNGTNASFYGMDLLLKKSLQIKNVNYEQAKGNLFEYIEAAKVNRNLANAGINRRFVVTDAKKEWGGLGEPHAPDDFRLFEGNKVIGKGGQAKVNNNVRDTASADKGISNTKYEGMQRVIASDKYDDVVRQLDIKLQNGEISKSMYEDVKRNLREQGLTEDISGVSSGGTTTSELKSAYDDIDSYIRNFEKNQVIKEIGNTTINTAAASMIVTGIVSSTTNIIDVLQDKKELNEAIKDLGVDVVKSGARGGITGFLSSTLRIASQKASIPVLSDGSAATALAGGLVDCGVSVYSYAKGEISSEDLVEEMSNTAIKTVSTIYLTKAIQLTLGNTPAFVPMMIYTTASYVVTTCREIIKSAKLNACEYNRIASLYDEATEKLKEYRKKVNYQLEKFEAREKEMLSSFIKTFDYNMKTGENYDNALMAITMFSHKYGLKLQHVDLNDFKKAMINDDDFILR